MHYYLHVLIHFSPSSIIFFYRNVIILLDLTQTNQLFTCVSIIPYVINIELYKKIPINMNIKARKMIERRKVLHTPKLSTTITN